MISYFYKERFVNNEFIALTVIGKSTFSVTPSSVLVHLYASVSGLALPSNEATVSRAYPVLTASNVAYPSSKSYIFVLVCA